MISREYFKKYFGKKKQTKLETLWAIEKIVVTGGQDFRLPQKFRRNLAAFGEVAGFRLRHVVGRNTNLVVETLTDTVRLAAYIVSQAFCIANETISFSLLIK